MSAGQLAERFRITRPRLSPHFNTLTQAGLLDLTERKP